MGSEMCIRDSIPTVVAPFKRPEVVIEIMGVITEHLSRANLHNPIGQWVGDPARANIAAATIALANNCGTEVGAIPALRGAATFIEEAVEWIQRKMNISCDVIMKDAYYLKLEGENADIVNRVVARSLKIRPSGGLMIKWMLWKK